jgi:hypothetical protein
MPDLNRRHGRPGGRGPRSERGASDSPDALEAVEGDINAALDEIRAARPASDFVPRLRAHVERVRPSVLSRWSLPAAAVAMAVVSSFIVGYERGARDTPTVRPVASVAGSAAASMQHPVAPQRPLGLQPPRGRTVTRSLFEMPRVGQTSGQSPQGRPAPAPGSPGSLSPGSSGYPGNDVLVPAEERAAVGRLVEALQAGRADAVSMLRSINAVTTGAAVTPDTLTVPPIQIDPVVVAPFPSVPPVLENVKESS